MSSSKVLIPAKFVSIILHLIITACIIANYTDNILASGILQTDTENWNTAKQNILAASWLTMIGLFIEIVILFIGINMHQDQLNISQVIAHSFGIVLYAWFTLDTWRHNQLWSPWFFFGLCPLVVEIYSASSTVLFFKKFKA